MSSITNHGLVHNQIAGVQNVDGSVYHAPVTNIVNHGCGHLSQTTNSDTRPANQDDGILQKLAFSGMFERRSNIDSPHQNTCQWILDTCQFRTWCAQPRGLLWIKGKPGSGKSILMASLFESFKTSCTADEIVLDFFFSARGSDMQRLPLGMLRSLLHQAFLLDDGVRSILRASHAEFGSTDVYDADSLSPWTRQTLEKLLMRSLSCVGEKRKVTIFIDALDEAGERNAREVARYIHQLNDRMTDSSAMVRICISSRHYPVPSVVPGLEIWVEAHNTDDVSTFIHDRLGLDYRNSWETSELEQWFDLKANLVKRANGVFQWIAIVMPMLEQQIDDGDPISEARERIEKLPQELRGLYEHIIREVIDPRHRQQSYLLFQWIHLAYDTLQLDMLRYAFVASKADSPLSCRRIPEFIKSNELMRSRVRALSGGLLEVIGYQPDLSKGESEDDSLGRAKVQVIHQSVTDFLREGGFELLAVLADDHVQFPRESDVADYDICAQNGHGVIYRSCLNTLASETSLEPSRQERNSVRANYPWIYWERISASSIPSLAAYAFRYLLRHARESLANRGIKIEKEFDLLSISLPRWNVWTSVNEFKPFRRLETTVLHMAAEGNMVDITQLAVKIQNEQIDKFDDDGMTALARAISYDHTLIMEILIDVGADINETRRGKDSPLACAARQGSLSAVETLLRAGATQQINHLSLKSALEAAAEKDHCEVVDAILSYAKDLSVYSSLLEAALFGAVEGDSIEIMQRLLTRDDRLLTSKWRHRALVNACQQSAIQCVQLLLRIGANVNAVPAGEPVTALWAACEEQDETLVALLLSKGADVRIAQSTGAGLLSSAVMNESILQMLLDAGADVNSATDSQLRGSALSEAYSFSPDSIALTAVPKLIDAGADVNYFHQKHDTALQSAARHCGSIPFIQYLISQGAQVNAPLSGKYGTALQAAVRSQFESAFLLRSGPPEVVRFLLNAGADVNAQGGYYGSALQAAVAVEGKSFSKRQCLQVVEMLLDAGADVNAQGGVYGNALEAAIARDQWDLAEMLIEHGAVDMYGYARDFFCNLDDWAGGHMTEMADAHETGSTEFALS